MTIEEGLGRLDLDADFVDVEALTGEDLMDFARYGDTEALQTVVASGFADRLTLVDDRENSLLHMAAANGHDAVASLLLQLPEVRKRTVNLRNCEGNTPLHWAALNGQGSLVRLLLAHGADLKAENAGRQTPWDEAVAREHSEVTAAIIEFLEKHPSGDETAVDTEEMESVSV